MKHQFSIIKHIPASIDNVVANYLDIEHIPVHPDIKELWVLSETNTCACFLAKMKVFGITFNNIQYFEFRPPNQVFQALDTLLGPMQVLSTIQSKETKQGIAQCEVLVEVTLELPWILYWTVRPWVEQVLRRSNRRVLEEDLEILLRRQSLFGDKATDYLRKEQRILFKEAFQQHYGPSKRGSSKINKPLEPAE